MSNPPQKSREFLVSAIATLAAGATVLVASVTYASTPIRQSLDGQNLDGQNLIRQDSDQDLAQIESIPPNTETDSEADSEADSETDSEIGIDRAPILIPGTSVSLQPPAGFVTADQFSGLVNPESLASIVIAELPAAAYTEFVSLFASTPEAVTSAFAERGIVLEVDTISNVLVNGNEVPLVKGIQTVGDTQVSKYFALFGGETSGENTILITFNVTEPASLSEEAIVNTIQSIQVAPALSIEQKVAELPFTFEVAPPFQVFDVLLGSTVLLSPNGEPSPSGEDPVIIIASSVSPIIAADLSAFDLATFSSQVLLETEGFTQANITTRSPTEFAGGEGYVIQASVADSTVFQYLRILPNNFYIRMLAAGNTEAIAELVPTIEAIQSSVEAKP
ncbi:hypothetical protein [cf. Phormidesmis sp. LEGE 11477]|uniref:hypothetical protein n=1 Tax=cf. Phormidesmis sp. LEGE 11477 TaxID=1828680 RepID=UPI001880B56F|nr:hypothetical protein [cf. Phormidesmis sp. LEGE 11477]MBE9063263.1 hypothetical protein [cf. Phormidesmis sp. LEGE 11477]